MPRFSLCRFGLILIGSGLAALFLLDSVSAGPPRLPNTPPPVIQPPPPPVNQPPFIPRQPVIQPPPIIQPQVPVFETVWTCSRCNAELSRGGTRPSVTRCPRCGARIINGIGPDPGPGNAVAPVNFGGAPNPGPLAANPFVSSSSSRTTTVLLIVGGFLGVAVLVAAIVVVVVVASRRSKPSRRRKVRTADY